MTFESGVLTAALADGNVRILMVADNEVVNVEPKTITREEMDKTLGEPVLRILSEREHNAFPNGRY